jgi:hypothetical protein
VTEEHHATHITCKQVCWVTLEPSILVRGGRPRTSKEQRLSRPGVASLDVDSFSTPKQQWRCGIHIQTFTNSSTNSQLLIRLLQNSPLEVKVYARVVLEARQGASLASRSFFPKRFPRFLRVFLACQTFRKNQIFRDDLDTLDLHR